MKLNAGTGSTSSRLQHQYDLGENGPQRCRTPEKKLEASGFTLRERISERDLKALLSRDLGSWTFFSLFSKPVKLKIKMAMQPHLREMVGMQ